MKTQYTRQLETLVKVRAFGQAHSDLFPPSSLSGKMFGVIANAILRRSCRISRQQSRDWSRCPRSKPTIAESRFERQLHPPIAWTKRWTRCIGWMEWFRTRSNGIRHWNGNGRSRGVSRQRGAPKERKNNPARRMVVQSLQPRSTPSSFSST